MIATIVREEGQQGGQLIATIVRKEGQQGGQLIATIVREKGQQGGQLIATIVREEGQLGGQLIATIVREEGQQGGQLIATVKIERINLQVYLQKRSAMVVHTALIRVQNAGHKRTRIKMSTMPRKRMHSGQHSAVVLPGLTDRQ